MYSSLALIFLASFGQISSLVQEKTTQAASIIQNKTFIPVHDLVITKSYQDPPRTGKFYVQGTFYLGGTATYFNLQPIDVLILLKSKLKFHFYPLAQSDFSPTQSLVPPPADWTNILFSDVDLTVLKDSAVADSADQGTQVQFTIHVPTSGDNCTLVASLLGTNIDPDPTSPDEGGVEERSLVAATNPANSGVKTDTIVPISMFVHSYPTFTKNSPVLLGFGDHVAFTFKDAPIARDQAFAGDDWEKLGSAGGWRGFGHTVSQSHRRVQFHVGAASNYVMLTAFGNTTAGGNTHGEWSAVIRKQR